jgi:hypothetical protein
MWQRRLEKRRVSCQTVALVLDLVNSPSSTLLWTHGIGSGTRNL